MSGIKVLKGYENLGPVYKKPFYEILSGDFLHLDFACILDFTVHRKYRTCLHIDSSAR